MDEAHNFGARTYAKLLDNRFTYRLALSATLERHRDEEGTTALYKFFGKKCIVYTLDRAIDEKKLTPYKYYPVFVTLTETLILPSALGLDIVKSDHSKFVYERPYPNG